MRYLPLSLLLLAACQTPEAQEAPAPTTQPAATSQPTATTTTTPASYPGYNSYGANFTVKPALNNTVNFATVATNPEAYSGKTFTMTGTIGEVCQSKGCWMTFTDGDADMRVKFKDYAFFMPMDSMGKTAVIEGEFQFKLVPAEEEAHYLEDAGKMEEAAAMTEDQIRLTFMAASVLIAE